MRPSTFKDDYKYVKKQICPSIIGCTLTIISIIAIYATALIYLVIIVNYLGLDSTKAYTCPDGYILLKEHICIDKKMILLPNVTQGCNGSCEIKNMVGIWIYDLIISPFIIVPSLLIILILFYFKTRCTTCYYNSYIRVYLINRFQKKNNFIC